MYLQGSALAFTDSAHLTMTGSNIINGRTNNGGALFVRQATVIMVNTTFACNIDARKAVAIDVVIADDLDPEQGGSLVSCESSKPQIFESPNGDNGAFVNTDCPGRADTLLCPGIFNDV
jgi:hypothetical protein